MINFARRNLKIFFRDRSAVCFSLLASVIIIALYVFFLGDTWTDSFAQYGASRELMDNWVMAGLLAVTSVTTSMGAFGTMVNDRSLKIDKDFYSSPAKRSDIAGGYIISAAVVGFIMSVVTLVPAEIYIVANGGAIMSVAELFEVLGLIALADVANTAMIFFITTLIHSQSAFSTASTIIGTLIGFVTGIYLPIGSLPKGVQSVIKVFPTSHAAALLRNVMMKGTMNDVPAQYLPKIKSTLGMTYSFGSHTINGYGNAAVLAVTAAVFFALAVINMSKKKA